MSFHEIKFISISLISNEILFLCVVLAFFYITVFKLFFFSFTAPVIFFFLCFIFSTNFSTNWELIWVWSESDPPLVSSLQVLYFFIFGDFLLYGAPEGSQSDYFYVTSQYFSSSFPLSHMSVSTQLLIEFYFEVCW